MSAPTASQEAPGVIAAREAAIVAEFALFDDWMGRYEHLIDQGRALPPLDPAYRTDAYRIHGCQSNVWLRAELDAEGRMRFSADSDAQITRGLIALLIRALQGQPPAAVASAPLGFVAALGLEDHLSPTRKNGLAGMIRRIRQYAAAYADAAPPAADAP